MVVTYTHLFQAQFVFPLSLAFGHNKHWALFVDMNLLLLLFGGVRALAHTRINLTREQQQSVKLRGSPNEMRHECDWIVCDMGWMTQCDRDGKFCKCEYLSKRNGGLEIEMLRIEQFEMMRIRVCMSARVCACSCAESQRRISIDYKWHSEWIQIIGSWLF